MFDNIRCHLRTPSRVSRDCAKFAVVLMCVARAAMVTAEEVVVYTAHDEIYSSPILRAFEAQTGIKLRAAYDVEVSKTTGLVNRLIAERRNPQADVLWNNEVAQTIVLKAKGILEPYASIHWKSIPDRFKDPGAYWTGFAARARVIIYNTELVAVPPTSIFDLVEESWRGSVGIALPLFGTTATHAAALFAQLGTESASGFFKALIRNDALVLDGNSTVRDYVARGRLKAGLTDTDDANGAVLDGFPVRWLFPDQKENEIGTLLIPNTVCLIKDGPNPGNGRKLIDYLLSPEVEERLASSRALQIPVRESIRVTPETPRLDRIKVMSVSFEDIAAKMESTARFIQNEFVR